MSPQEKITLNPALVSVVEVIAGDPVSPWTQASDAVSMPSDATVVVGMMPVQLVHNSEIKSLRATGFLQFGDIRVSLIRENVAEVGSSETVVTLTPTTGDAFDQTEQAPNNSVAKVDNDNFRYYIEASAVVPIPGGAQNALYAFQIAYQS